MIRRTSKAFTLIELLFVVAIIAVLAAIAVPNFLEAQTRSKIARARADMQVIKVGLGRYQSDHGAYPSNHPDVLPYLEAALQNTVMAEGVTTEPEGSPIPWYSQNLPSPNNANNQYAWHDYPPLKANGRSLSILTTPVAYLETSLPYDVFDRYKGGAFAYINSYDLFRGKNMADLKGLQGDHLTSATVYIIGSGGPDSMFSMWHPINGPWIDYDPTNGTASGGDLMLYEGRKPSSVVSDEMKETLPVTYADPWPGMI